MQQEPSKKPTGSHDGRRVVRIVQRPKSRVKKPASRAGGNPIFKHPSQQQYSRLVKSKTTTKTKDLKESILKENKIDEKHREVEKQEIVKEEQEKESTKESHVTKSLSSSENGGSQTQQEDGRMKKMQVKELQVEEMQLIEDHCEEIEGNTEDTNTEEVRINLRRCMYSVVETVASALGMCIMKDDSENWDIYWSDYSLSTLKSKCMNMFQRINHFPGMANLESKAFLAFHLNRMRTQFQDDYNFFPKSWSLPYQYQECISYLEQNPKEVYILKPSRGAEGKGIKIFSDVKEVQNSNIEASCQMYLSDTMLLDGYKFDLRLYALITCIDPLQIFVYNNGLIRLATCPYHPPNEDNMTNQFMHLTNYSINKSSKDYDTTDEGSKRDFVAFSKWMQAQKLDEDKLWRDIDDVIIKTVISIHPILKEKYEELFPFHHKNNTNACFEMLGFDIILDRTMKPFLLEVNRSPSFNITGFVDDKVKRNLIFDTFKLLNLHTKPVNSDLSNELGNYRQIYPPNRMFDYSKFIHFIFVTSETTDDKRRKKM